MDNTFHSTVIAAAMMTDIVEDRTGGEDIGRL